MPKYSPFLGNTCVRRVVFDKWFPLRGPAGLSRDRDGAGASRYSAPRRSMQRAAETSLRVFGKTAPAPIQLLSTRIYPTQLHPVRSDPVPSRAVRCSTRLPASREPSAAGAAGRAPAAWEPGVQHATEAVAAWGEHFGH